MATKIAHEIDPQNQIGCMIIAVPRYGITPDPRDQLTAQQKSHEDYAFGNIHVRGEYPGYLLHKFRERVSPSTSQMKTVRS
ncbi:beta-glucosidase [Corynebacterium glutamicum]|nr:beta-glucosidase [Corynebacterium glutamicum]MBA4569407.1 beta-glucosidase [Corynebacterium glutamicum]MBA4571968.1 beta-glucosidase [Corynebacterium glutamicum]MBA4577124.1 beta-glucosidase [Corynebacterium glutamicum]MBA4578569.1 beta-glucosidase [Corynebacterium glutamicum]MBA4581087.1 beta-glucosidase [Corynebacterium glutamicum]